MCVRCAVAFCLGVGLSLTAATQEQKRLEDIRREDFAQDMQQAADETPTSHMNLSWRIPLEYWAVVLAGDAGLSPKARPQIMASLSKYSLLAVGPRSFSGDEFL